MSKRCIHCNNWARYSENSPIGRCNKHNIDRGEFREICSDYQEKDTLVPSHTAAVSIHTYTRSEGWRHTIYVRDDTQGALVCILATMNSTKYENTLEALRHLLDALEIEYKEEHTNVA